MNREEVEKLVADEVARRAQLWELREQFRDHEAHVRKLGERIDRLERARSAEHAKLMAALRPILLEARQFPHCDQFVLHAPGACEFCDGVPELQRARVEQGVCFTGEADPSKMRCPSEQFRPRELLERWPGNRPSPRDR